MGSTGRWPPEAAKEAGRFREMLEIMAGERTLDAESRAALIRQIDASLGAEPVARIAVRWLLAYLDRLERRVAALEAELSPAHRGRRCPRCASPALEVAAAAPHPDPELAALGIERHEVRCRARGCGYRGIRLYDPSGYIR